MNEHSGEADVGNRSIARLLWTGTCIASAILALGMLAGLLKQWGLSPPRVFDADHLLSAGIVIFVLLPVARVIATLITFARARDLLYMAFAGFVLLVIGLGVLWELRLP